MSKKESESRGKDEAQTLDDLRKLSITAAHELLSGFDRLKQLRDDWEGSDVNGRVDESQKRRERAKALAYELARHEIKHAEKILSLSHAQADLLFEHARSLVRRMRYGDSPSPAVVELRAATSEPSEPAVGSLGIRNPFDTNADPRFHLGPFSTQSGDEVAGLKVKLSCDPSCVPPHGDAEVMLEVDIEGAEGCAPGVYFAELTVFLVGVVEQRVARRLLRLRIGKTREGERNERGGR
ncbi:MAG: hypothetical protein BGO98_31585 [Myxococcales bacterium 68-20]|nr:hypothetical protein [Myxococcales bacterium]OJY18300.1 MAG: hypothetical protein BGO98_31585 [Myxococcales bacterium 68-20]